MSVIPKCYEHRSFSVAVAVDHGVNEAIILENIRRYVDHNAANGVEEHDGRFWTRSSASAFADLHPYMSHRTIQRVLSSLVEKGLVESGKFESEDPFDNSNWYTVTSAADRYLSDPRGHHAFSVELAAEHGVLAAIILENIMFWIRKNEANGYHFHEGKHWTYNSSAAFLKQFPYSSRRTIARTLEKLVADDLLETSKFDGSKYNQTKWYALGDKLIEELSAAGGNGASNETAGQLDGSKMANGLRQNGQWDGTEWPMSYDRVANELRQSGQWMRPYISTDTYTDEYPYPCSTARGGERTETTASVPEKDQGHGWMDKDGKEDTVAFLIAGLASSMQGCGSGHGDRKASDGFVFSEQPEAHATPCCAVTGAEVREEAASPSPSATGAASRLTDETAEGFAELTSLVPVSKRFVKADAAAEAYARLVDSGIEPVEILESWKRYMSAYWGTNDDDRYVMNLERFLTLPAGFEAHRPARKRELPKAVLTCPECGGEMQAIGGTLYRCSSCAPRGRVFDMRNVLAQTA